MDATLYIFALPFTVNGMTHVAVKEEHRNAGRIYIIGVYGRDLVGGFRPGEMMAPFQDNIAGERFVDLDEQSKAAGRPAGKARYAIESADVAEWLEEDPDDIRERIIARRPDPEEVTDA